MQDLAKTCRMPDPGMTSAIRVMVYYQFPCVLRKLRRIRLKSAFVVFCEYRQIPQFLRKTGGTLGEGRKFRICERTDLPFVPGTGMEGLRCVT